MWGRCAAVVFATTWLVVRVHSRKFTREIQGGKKKFNLVCVPRNLKKIWSWLQYKKVMG
jgi:hypothetical protein